VTGILNLKQWISLALPQPTGRFVVLNKNLIALHIGKFNGIKGNDTLKNDLVFLDIEGHIVGRHFPFETPLFFEFGNPFTRPDADGSYYYSKQFDFNIYRVKDTSQPTVFLKLDYGKCMGTLADHKGPPLRILEYYKQRANVRLLTTL